MSERASEAIVAHKLALGGYRYTITLKDTGTTLIGTFWFAWVPGEDFLPRKPHAAAPTGWTEHVLGGTPPLDGYSIQWVANSSVSALRPGQSRTFVFTSAATPTQVFGHSTIHPPTPVTTSFVYSGMPFSDAGYKFSASSTKVLAEPPGSLANFGDYGSAMGGASSDWSGASMASPNGDGSPHFGLTTSSLLSVKNGLAW